MLTIELRVSDPAELRSLRALLERIPNLAVTQRAGEVGPGELGAWDFLQVVAAGGGAMTVLLQTIPEFIRSRRTDVAVTVKTESQEIVVTAANADDALRLLDRALNG